MHYHILALAHHAAGFQPTKSEFALVIGLLAGSVGTFFIEHRK